MPTPSRKTILLATDQQRSVWISLDESLPHPVAYTPYGHRPLNGLLSLLGFNGELPDPVTGHYHLGNGYRQFNPVLMRFNSPDSWSPFGEGGLNTYIYCGNDPINRFDPDGHAWWKLLVLRRSGHRRLAENTSTALPNISLSRSTSNAGNLAGSHPTVSAAAENVHPAQSSKSSTWLKRWQEKRQIKHDAKIARRIEETQRYKKARDNYFSRRAAMWRGLPPRGESSSFSGQQSSPIHQVQPPDAPPAYNTLFPDGEQPGPHSATPSSLVSSNSTVRRS